MNKLITPIEKQFRMPAEWHRHERCWMAWPCHQETWAAVGLDKARQAYARVANAIASFEPVTMLVNPGDEQDAQRLLNPGISIFSIPLNDSWTRDTGPTFLLNAQGELAGVDWIHNAWGGNYPDCALDNKIAASLIHESKAEYFHAPLVMEGGSFHVDGEGTLMTSKECLLNANRNPSLSQHQIEIMLKDYLGVETIIWLNRGLEGDETDGHVDEIACFVAPAKVLALVTSDQSDINYQRLQENLSILKNSKDAKGRSLEVIGIEQPPATYLGVERLTLSYINFYLANQGLVIPAFGYPDYDQAAYNCFRQLFPGHAIKQIDALDVFAGGGGIHCITQQQPAVG